MSNFAAFCNALESVESAIICAHVSPDPDAIGSSFGLQRILDSRGVLATVYVPEGVPQRLLPLIEGCPWSTEVPSGPVSAVIVVDTATRNRVGPEVDTVLARGATILTLDHHASNEGWGVVNCVDADSPATAELVLQVAESIGVTIDVQTANLLYAGLLDDTGSFCFSNTTERALLAASRLVAAGASPEHIANVLLFSVPERVLRLRARAIENLQLLADGRISLIQISTEDLQAVGGLPEDTEGLVDIARMVEGTQAAVFMRQLPSGWKFSLRSKTDALDVNQVAQQFGGGGHIAAAGCRVDGDTQTAQDLVVAALTAALQRI